ncbi:MAG: type II toxin-antitoxin system YafQ family toxin [Bacilli bacterium]|nr:type II toxin-antitoxin system YafQ family toxin [Bacilli bacterium]
MDFNIKTKYKIETTTDFKKGLKKAIKRGLDISKLMNVINILASGNQLDECYSDHVLFRNKRYKDCRECHIEPNWLLVYKINKDTLILLLYDTGSHSDLFE